ncbi:unnamed protein product [Trichobilharzia szidati]|nr:unnamed protein product [Trichobilharzia szidati]
MCTNKVPELKDTKHLLEYLKELLTDRINLLASSDLYIHVLRILEKEILNVRSELFSAFGIYQITDEELPAPEGRKVSLQAKVYMPTGTSNNYNFVGRILGPDGSTAKCLQQFLGVRIMIRGRGSMRDQTKEEANVGRPNWEHLNDNLHVLISVEDYENRAKARIEKASEYISLFLEESVKVSDKDDKVKLMQSMELSIMRKAFQQGQQQQSSGIIIPTSHQSILPGFNGFTQYPQQTHTPSFQSSGASDLSSTLYLQNNGGNGGRGVGVGVSSGADAASFNGTFGFTNTYRSNYQPTYSQSGSSTLGVSVGPPVGINYWPGNYSSQSYPIPQSQCYQNVTAAAINANAHNNNNSGHNYQQQFQKQQQYHIPEKYLSEKLISSQKLMNNGSSSSNSSSIPSQSSYATPLIISAQHQQQQQQCDHCRQLYDDQLSTVNCLSKYPLNNNKHNYPIGKHTSVAVVVHTKSNVVTNARSNSDSCMSRTHNNNNSNPPVRRQVHGNESVNKSSNSSNNNNNNKSFNSIYPTKQPATSVESKRRYSQKHNRNNNDNNNNNGSNLNHTEASNDSNSNESVLNHNNSTRNGSRPNQAQSDSVVVSKMSNKENNNSSGSPDESYRHAAANVSLSCSPLTERTVSVTTTATTSTTTTTPVIPDHSNVDQIVAVDESNTKHESSSSSSSSIASSSSCCKNSQSNSNSNNNNNTKSSDTSVKSVALIIDETEWPKLETAVNTKDTRKTSFTVARKTFKRSSMLNGERQQTKKL